MATTTTPGQILLICLFMFSTSVLTSKCQETAPVIAPAIYVFGDSTVDAGNAYGGYPPAWNKTIADTIVLLIWLHEAALLGLPSAPPFRFSSDEQKSTSLTGFNYAFAGVGMLPETRNAYDAATVYWGFQDQITFFKETINTNLAKNLDSQHLSAHLSDSIFLISFATNDFQFNYLPPSSGSLSHLEPEAFAKLLLASMASHLTTVNSMVLPYSVGLPNMLTQLQANLSGASFSNSDNFAFVADLKHNPSVYGITNTRAPCNVGLTHCNDEDQYLYYDNLHITSRASRVFGYNCFNGTLCAPNIIKLVAK
ncbi:hypothetical protein RHSIM_Rhsim09G0120600 [Rhododendron simsii]|uniref:GDSL esterase/lipase n=1 Tax=Rhododendron simsii TaxID=118357 RepID=A0A834LDE2_RHOSS|nr:hypothetical protein RHSIM_Rhsim09G0120600 [Rhododendron simsii]